MKNSYLTANERAKLRIYINELKNAALEMEYELKHGKDKIIAKGALQRPLAAASTAHRKLDQFLTIRGNPELRMGPGQ